MIHKYLYGAFAALLFLSACNSQPSASPSPTRPLQGRLLRTEPAITPEWKNRVPKSDTEVFFVGLSRQYASAADARDDAHGNAFTQVMRFYGEFIQASTREASSYSESSSGTIEAYINLEESINTFAQAIVSQVSADRYYTEVYLNEKNNEEYIVYVLCQIPRQKAEDDIRNFASQTSVQYANLLTRQDTVDAALRMYAGILTALDNNPLHRTVAFYDSPNGRVGLYDYVSLQLTTLASSIAFSPLPAAVVQKTDTLDVTIRLASPAISAVGSLDCAVAVYGVNNPSPSAVYTLTAGNSFPLSLPSQKLDSGAYTVRLELPLNRISSHIAKNPAGSFSLEVLPLYAPIEFRGVSLSQAEQAVFSQGVQQGVQRNQTPLRLSAPPANAQNRYGLVITVEQAQGSPELALFDVSLAFIRNATVIRQSETKRIVEMDRHRAFTQAAVFIRDNTPFFQGIADTLR